VRNDSALVSLKVRNNYRSIPDESAAARKTIRVSDESGKDSLYPSRVCVPIELPANAKNVFASRS
jgi:hypothetical protein